MVHFGGIGDMVLTTAALKEIYRSCPKAKVTVICSSRRHAEFLLNFEFVEDVVAFNIYGMDTRQIFKKDFWAEIHRILRYLRRKPFDLLLNFHAPVLIDWYLIEFGIVALSKAGYTAGINPTYLPGLSVYQRWISGGHSEDMHDKDRFLNIIRLLDISPRKSDTVFPIAKMDAEYAEKLLRAFDGSNAPIAIIHVGGSSPHNLWPVDKYAEVSNWLIGRNFRVIVVGSDADRIRGAALSKSVSGVYDLTGKTTVGQSAALIARASVFIGNDSSQFHVAVAVNTPAIGLIGGGHPRFHLYERDNIRVIKKKVSCAPCNDRTCRRMDCMQKIMPQDVIAAVGTLLPGSTSNSATAAGVSRG